MSPLIGRQLRLTALVAALILLVAACSIMSTGVAGDCKVTDGDYGMLATAARQLATAKAAIYGRGDLPLDLTADMLLDKVKSPGPLPDSYYEELKAYRLVMEVKGSEYILKVYDPNTGCLVLYDCSCSQVKLDGPVHLNPDAYYNNNLECDCQ